jgi:type IV pilus biogenesis protein CpaD/CtpE|tara:strand:+ start:91996 stop:92658 length:663 start_codon:yes stop_codon:yes gene_type:complete
MTLKPTLIIPFAVLCLSGCSDNYFTPTSITDKKIEIVETGYERTIDVAAINDGELSAIARDYKRYGSNGLNLTISYDPSTAGSFSASDAMKKGSELANVMRRDHYVNAVNVAILPLRNTPPRLFIDYTKTQAQKPAGCGVAPGLDNQGTATEDRIEDYEIGCSVKTLIAKQVYRPSDLAGTGASTSDYNSRRGIRNLQGTGYYDGAPNAPIEGGQTATDD